MKNLCGVFRLASVAKCSAENPGPVCVETGFGIGMQDFLDTVEEEYLPGIASVNHFKL